MESSQDILNDFSSSDVVKKGFGAVNQILTMKSRVNERLNKFGKQISQKLLMVTNHKDHIYNVYHFNCSYTNHTIIILFINKIVYILNSIKITKFITKGKHLTQK